MQETLEYMESKMPKQMTSETDALTGETIVRELSAEEIAQRNADLLEIANKELAEQAEAQSKAEAKVALFAKLGITADEAALLLS